MEQMHLGVITEAAYLTAGNTPQYRRIMRIFYEENEKMHYRLLREEVLRLLRACPGFEHYEDDQLKQDLASLVAWHNLIAMQDPRRVYTIEDYKNKQFRYAMSENALEIERLTIRLEHLVLQGGTLSSSYVVRLEQLLGRAVSVVENGTLKEVNEWWRDLQEDFERLNQNYKDYLREFYAGDADHLMKSVEFVMHKDRFIAYLQEFVQELRVHAARIAQVLTRISPEQEAHLLARVKESERDVPRTGLSSQPLSEEELRRLTEGRWQTLRSWFLPTNGEPSECSRILDITDEIIRKIIRQAALLVQMQNWGVSRKDDYRHYISLFQNCRDLNEAHCLAAHLFGIQQVRHYKVNSQRATENINSSVYEEEPSVYVMKPRTRTWKPRVDRTGFEDKAMAKQMQKQTYLRQQKEEHELVLRYIRGGELDISQIEGTVSVRAREVLLRWIAAAHLSAGKTGRTEYGQVYRLRKGRGTCVLHCADGDLTMPVFILQFQEDRNHG